jgi:hypothetical protein
VESIHSLPHSLSWAKPIQFMPPARFLKTHFNVIFPAKLRCSKRCMSLMFPHPSHSSGYASCKLLYFTSYNFSSFYLILNGPKKLVLGRDRVVGTATHYRLGGPGIKSHWGRDFPHTPRPALGPTQPPVQSVPSLFPWGKAAGAWR